MNNGGLAGFSVKRRNETDTEIVIEVDKSILSNTTQQDALAGKLVEIMANQDSISRIIVEVRK